MTVTNAAEWRKAREEGFEMELPFSQKRTAIRPIEIDFFLRVGRIPDVLSDTVTKLIGGAPVSFPVPSEEAQKTEEWLTFLSTLMTHAFVSPKVVVGQPREDEISVDDIPYGDKMFIYRFFCQPAQALQRFCEKQAKSVGSMVPAQNNGHPAEPALMRG